MQDNAKNAVQLANAGLASYEIKRPDYDYFNREKSALADQSFAPSRYALSDGMWKSLNKPASKDKVRLMFVGDITCFGKQFTEAETENGYNFDYEFDLVKGLFANADLVCGNLETMIVPEAPYRGEKLMSEQSFFCNAPIEFLDALRKANFDVLTTANNHDLDTGAVGIGETIDHVKQFGFIQTGTFNTEKPRYELIDVCGYKIAIIAFATEHNNKAENLTREGQDFLLNTYSASSAKKIIKEAREAGAELVFVSIHWGTEHSLEKDAKQDKIAADLAKMGCDCIIGAHPHVLQPYGTVKADDKQIPVFYSLGNFVCSTAAGPQSRAAIACVDLVRKDGKIELECSYIPTVTTANYGERGYVVMPINKDTANETNAARLKRIKKVLGKKAPITADVQIPDYEERPKERTASTKVTPPDLSTVTEFPIVYDDGAFSYTVFKDYVRFDGLSVNCNPKQTVSIPGTVLGLPVKDIKAGALAGTEVTARVAFRAPVPELNEGVCKDCANLEGFQLDRAITKIGPEAFANCVKLSGIVIKGQCSRIESRAFANCTELRCVKISSDISYIADDAFEGCDKAIFYCAKGSYVDRYARTHQFEAVYMPNYPNYAQVGTITVDPATVPLLEDVVMGPRNLPTGKHPKPIIATCYHIGKPLPANAKCGNPPSYYIGKDTFDGKLSTVQALLGDKMPEMEEEELTKSFKKFKQKFHTQLILDHNETDFTVYFCDWLLYAKARGFSHDNYFDFELYNKEPKIRDTFLNEGFRRRVRKVCNQPSARGIMANKGLFNSTFHEFVQRDWLDASICSFEEFKAFAEKHDRCFGKPICGTGGSGARIIDLNSDTVENLYEICKADGLIVEEVVKQHPTLAEFNDSTLNTVRVNTLLCADGTTRVLLTVARFGRSGNVVDNFHSGGVGAIVDIPTGRIITNAINQAHQCTPIHPDSGKEFLNFQFPEWPKVVDSVCRAAKLLPELRHVGWDVAVTVDGNVEFVEGNARPNFDVLQSPDQLGRRFRYEEHIKELELQAGITRKNRKPLEIDITGMELPAPEDPYGSKISAITKEGIEFYWKKLEKTSGYEIFRSYEAEGDYEMIADITKSSIGTYLDSEFDHEKKAVYYTVRSYLNDENGKRIYSEKLPPVAAVFREELIPEREVTYLYSGYTRSLRAFYGWGEVADIKWTSSDEAVATISADGLITAVSSGECVLTCSSETLNLSAESRVIVDRKGEEPLGEINPRFTYNAKKGWWENKNAEKTNKAVIMMVGDMMCGKKQMKKQWTEEEGWNFNDSFEYVREITATSDFAMGNLETLLAPGWPYMLDEAYIDNKNNCNASSRYLDAVRYGGFDAVAMANNHNCDGGKTALLETIRQVDKYQLARTGAFLDKHDKRFFVVDINGIKVGFLAYISAATGFNGKDQDWSREDKNTVLNIFSKDKAKRDVAALKAAGAEYIIAYMHWGYKNYRTVVQHQLEDAQAVADAGVDYIVGANPHVVQAYDVLTAKDGREVPCIYSTGNFQAVMKQITGNRDSVIMRIRLKRDEKGKVVLARNNYIPCYTYTTKENSSWAPVCVSKKFNTEVPKSGTLKIRTRIAEAIGDKLKKM